MKIKLFRFSSNNESTLGLIYFDNKFECYSLENPFQKEKEYGNTRISPGKYKLKLRKIGGMNSKYEKKFANIHEGMLWLEDVPNFQYIYIHIGNSSNDTKGCILVGDGINNNQIEKVGFLSNSTKAYMRIYAKIVKAMEKEDVFIEIV